MTKTKLYFNAFEAIVCTVLVVLSPCTLGAALQLGSLFTDQMVLQQDMVVPVWGKADPGEKVTVAIYDQEKVAKTNAAGEWRVELEPLGASAEPRTMTVSAGSSGDTITIDDVLVGEVWICSGQSNMQMNVAAVPEIEALSSEATNIRSFTVRRTVSFDEQDACDGEWVDHHPDSAVAFAFAHFLERSSGVPVGIVLSAWGSSSIEAWMPRDMTKSLPHFQVVMEEFDANVAAQDRINAVLNGPKPWSREDDIFLRRQPNILYNAMMKPLIPYACRGLVWYQGERNTRSLNGMDKEPWFARTCGMLDYGDVLKQWIQRYRREWGRPELQFLVVMLPGYGKILDQRVEGTPGSPDVHSWAWMRESQLEALELPHAAVANTIDLGDANDIHPKDKLPIGERLALLASRDTLGQDIEAQGPFLKAVQMRGDMLVVHFDHAVGLKTSDGRAPTGFWLADNPKNWVRADAVIEGQTVVLGSAEIEQPLYVRYAFAGKPEVNLVNGAGLPAYPFRTDRFVP